MKIGDLVIYKRDTPNDACTRPMGVGIVLGFDEDGDPLVHFQDDDAPTVGGDAYFSTNIEVINESR
tara:strand:+ start:97 stop:294 length:198 start_codon:yes stop_codon:yes gene_type:complete